MSGVQETGAGTGFRTGGLYFEVKSRGQLQAAFLAAILAAFLAARAAASARSSSA